MPEFRLLPGLEILIQDDFYQRLTQSPLAPWVDVLRQRSIRRLTRAMHGNLAGWIEILRSLPKVSNPSADLRSPMVRTGATTGCPAATPQRIRELLLRLHPWRKGPFLIQGVHVDSEWRSDWKWARVEPNITPLDGRLVLDIGCGNGYYAWRMLGAGAAVVLGIDPGILNNVQFHALQHFLGRQAVAVLPLAAGDLPPGLRCFDTVFSMGILYHRRSPMDHLLALRDLLRPGGELVLETLVITGDANQVLVPQVRYAKMRNVWFLPSCDALHGWLKRCGFRAIELCDRTITTVEEQRSTEWMRFHSLRDFLQAGNPSLTVEGLPAPERAIFTARSP